MSLMDFLFEGRPPPSGVTTGSTTTSVPQFMSDYAQSVLAKANSVASQPYQTYSGARIAPLTGDQQQAYQSIRSNVGSYKPQASAATSMFDRASGSNALGQAHGYISAAQGRVPEGINDYLNPYMDNVTNRAQELATRTWNENVMPGISDIFIRGGTYASSNMADKLMRGGRDVVEGLQSQANASLADAYRDSANMFQTDQSRIAGLGELTGQLANIDAQNALQAGQGYMGLAELVHGLGLKDAAALESAGAAQQAQVQKNLDLAYQDFQDQRNWDRDQIAFLSQILHGLPDQGSVQSSTETAPIGSEMQPSGLSQLISGATGLAGLLKAFRS